MSMLAEKRQKTRYVFFNTGRKPLWAKDEDNVGKKLMEQMGWSKGQGLGRESQGDPNFLNVNFKNDNKGVGFVGNTDKWGEHYDAFEDALSNLQKMNDDSNTDKNESENKETSIVSLEAKSKMSRARVHYHKFTRGKDTSRFTEDDMACILGSKQSKKHKNREDLETPAEVKAQGEEDSSDDHTENKESVQNNGLTTIHGGNLNEYFKKKMLAFYDTMSNVDSNSTENEKNIKSEESEDHLLKKKKKKNKDKTKYDNNNENFNSEQNEEFIQENQSFNCQDNYDVLPSKDDVRNDQKLDNDDNYQNDDSVSIKTNKKKRKKDKNEETIDNKKNEDIGITQNEETSVELPKKKRKKRKKQKLVDDPGLDSEPVIVKEIVNEFCDDSDSADDVQMLSITIHKKKKSKKSKSKNDCEIELTEPSDDKTQKKKKKHTKSYSEILSVEENECKNSTKKKKRKK